VVAWPPTVRVGPTPLTHFHPLSTLFYHRLPHTVSNFATHRVYSSGHQFIPVNEEAHAEAWALYREVFPPAGCCFVPPPVDPAKPMLREPELAAPLHTELERAAIDAAHVAVAELRGGEKLPFGWVKARAPPSYNGPLPKPTDADRDLFEECRQRWDSMPPPTPLLTIEGCVYEKLVWRAPMGGKSLVWVPVRVESGVSLRNAEAASWGGAGGGGGTSATDRA
jgi:hypothetical protein